MPTPPAPPALPAPAASTTPTTPSSMRKLEPSGSSFEPVAVMEFDGVPAAASIPKIDDLVFGATTTNPGARVAPGPKLSQSRLPCPILKFLPHGELPPDEAGARQIQRRSPAYAIINRELVRRSATAYLNDAESEKGQEILRDIHQVECGHHAASGTLVAKPFCHGFYCPTSL
ncbi:hypothetical protein ZWY2020_020390 [Hordeum vulgare]|nr:hypothetical protein ZWY2020_020390 [Hordeum vulgare]